MFTLTLQAHARTDLIDITASVSQLVAESGVEEGLCLVFVPHTTAAVTINENADPSVRRDLAADLDRLVPWDAPYTHDEGNSAAHVKSTLVGCQLSIPISHGRLVLGAWQGVYFCEFDGPRTRQVVVKITAG